MPGRKLRKKGTHLFSPCPNVEPEGQRRRRKEMRPLFSFKVLLAFSCLLLGADRALAYVGPGEDVTFIGYAMTLLWLVLAAFSAALLWPVYALVRRIRGGKDKPPTSSIGPAPEEVRAASHTSS